jgi:hypothetical protein
VTAGAVVFGLSTVGLWTSLRALKMLESRPCAIRDHRYHRTGVDLVVAALVLRLAVWRGWS